MFSVEQAMIALPRRIKAGSKVIGYFSYTVDGHVFCDGEACVIAGSSADMQAYLQQLPTDSRQNDLIRKTRFGDIIEGMRQGGAYAFDEAAYERFSHQANINGMEGLPAKGVFLEQSDQPGAMHFITYILAHMS